MIYLDAHVVVWLYAGLIDKLSEHASQLIEKNELIISPVIKLELTYLYEAKRIQATSDAIINELQSKIGLAICDLPFESIIKKAQHLTWTRDPFDRLIVAQTMARASRLITKDQTIRKQCRLAVW